MHCSEQKTPVDPCLMDRGDDSLTKAIQLHQSGAIDAAASLYRKLLRDDPRNTKVLQNLALIEAARNNDSAALCLYKQALDLVPDDIVLLNNYATFLRERHDKALAIQTLERALSLSPESPLTLQNLSFALAEAGETARAVGYLNQLLQIDHTCVAAHVFLGKIAALRGQRLEAITHFSDALRYAPEAVEPRLLRAAMFVEQQQFEDAATDFRRVLEIEPDHPTATYALGALGLEAVPDRAPSDYIRNLFDAYAGTFDHHLVGVLGYKTPQTLYEQYRRHAVSCPPIEVLDLGCGTGLSGEVFVTEGVIDGVDISMEMIKRARERGCYRDLHCKDLLAFMRLTPKRYTLVLACDVLVYLGDLAPFFDGLARVVSRAGYASFSVEGATSDDYQLKASRRYGHSLDYVARLASLYGFRLIAADSAVLRQEAGNSLTGYAVLIQSLI